MLANPYRWQEDRPEHAVTRGDLVARVERHLRRGVAVKLVGGRGMGKSVLLRQVEACFAGDPDTRVVFVAGPPEEATVPACVRDIAALLGLDALPRLTMDTMMEATSAVGAQRLILLIDEADQYVLLDPLERAGHLARAWFNRLEGLRKAWQGRIGIVIAGGLGILHVAHVLGSGLLSRAETCVVEPFEEADLRQLAAPFATRQADLDDETVAIREGGLGDDAIATLAALSGGNPALATFGLERLWGSDGDPIQVLRAEFGEFAASHGDFLRAVHAGVSYRGLVASPGQILSLVKQRSGSIAQETLRALCAEDKSPVDVAQAVQLLQAAGLVRVSGSIQADPLHIYPIASIVNLPSQAATGADPVERLNADIAAILALMHRFGRDFHGKQDLLEEKVFSSSLAVALKLLGWQEVVREVVQAAGYLDLRVGLRQGSLHGHAVVESKIWLHSGYKEVQKQVDAYRVFDTLHAVVVMFGARKVAGWAEDYELSCLNECSFERQPTPPDLVGYWRAETKDVGGSRRTEHFLVQIPKRS
jgi:hypothetical protein